MDFESSGCEFDPRRGRLFYANFAKRGGNMTTIRELIQKKGSEIWSIAPDGSALDALKLMGEKNVGALMVMSSDQVLGIISERDCARKLDIQNRSATGTKVSEIMTSKVLYVEASHPLEECMALMTEKNIRHLPVYEGAKLLGVISMRDVLKEVIADQKFIIAQLEHYITGGKQ
jgi:signal-transduction protein with cAMP-binding, CBS, and nucleotidyltransferase domain